MKIYFPLLVAALTIAVTNASRRPFAVLRRSAPPLTRKNPGQLALLRGGGGDGGFLGLKREVTGKIIQAAWLWQGTAFALSLEPQKKWYGFTSDGSPKATAIDFGIQNAGAAILSTAITSLCLQYLPDKSVHEAIGWCAFVWMIYQLKWLLNDTYTKANYGLDKVLFTTAMNSLALYAGFANPDWAEKAFHVVIAINTLFAVHGILLPASFSKFWIGEGENAEDAETKFVVKCFAYHLLAMEIHNYSLLHGVDPAKAIAYASIPVWALFVDGFFIGKEVDEHIKKPEGYLIWLVFFSIFLALSSIAV